LVIDSNRYAQFFADSFPPRICVGAGIEVADAVARLPEMGLAKTSL
jgi:hypothetical protein